MGEDEEEEWGTLEDDYGEESDPRHIVFGILAVLAVAGGSIFAYCQGWFTA